MAVSSPERFLAEADDRCVPDPASGGDPVGLAC
jgi:hypothetical protein